MGSAVLLCAFVVVDGLTGWQILRIPLDQDSWHRNWNVEDPAVVIGWSATGGTLLIDDCVFQGMEPFDGTYWKVVGGETAFLVNDEFTVEDTAVDVSLVQRWLWREYGRSLPSAAAGETWVGS